MSHRPALHRPRFHAVRDYGARLTDTRYWRPYVDEVCRRHDLLGAARTVTAGLAGTFPVFIVDGSLAVKLYGDLFDGLSSFSAEVEAYRLLAGQSRLPIPSLVAHGFLFDPGDAWRWPYLVTSVVPGRSLSDLGGALAYPDRVGLAAHLGTLVAALHRTPLPPAGPLQGTWENFTRAMARRRQDCLRDHERWQDLPPGMVAQVAGYLLPETILIERGAAPVLVHGDLNADHVLGEVGREGWRTTGIIDFGDARVGDPTYDLVALHLGLFHCDKRLLRSFLRAYGFPPAAPDRFVRRAMTYTLLFEFGLGALRSRFPALDTITDLHDLAQRLWNVDSPGLVGSEHIAQ